LTKYAKTTLYCHVSTHAAISKDEQENQGGDTSRILTVDCLAIVLLTTCKGISAQSLENPKENLGMPRDKHHHI
jgi:hypothetical protein